MITTQTQIRELFWSEHPALEQQARDRGTKSKGQNAQLCDCRMAFVDFVDHLYRNHQISDKLAQRATL